MAAPATEIAKPINEIVAVARTPFPAAAALPIGIVANCGTNARSTTANAVASDP